MTILLILDRLNLDMMLEIRDMQIKNQDHHGESGSGQCDL